MFCLVDFSSLFYPGYRAMRIYTWIQRLGPLPHSRFLTDAVTAFYFIINKINFALQLSVKTARLGRRRPGLQACEPQPLGHITLQALPCVYAQFYFCPYRRGKQYMSFQPLQVIVKLDFVNYNKISWKM